MITIRVTPKEQITLVDESCYLNPKHKVINFRDHIDYLLARVDKTVHISYCEECKKQDDADKCRRCLKSKYDTGTMIAAAAGCSLGIELAEVMINE